MPPLVSFLLFSGEAVVKPVRRSRAKPQEERKTGIKFIGSNGLLFVLINLLISMVVAEAAAKPVRGRRVKVQEEKVEPVKKPRGKKVTAEAEKPVEKPLPGMKNVLIQFFVFLGVSCCPNNFGNDCRANSKSYFFFAKICVTFQI